MNFKLKLKFFLLIGVVVSPLTANPAYKLEKFLLSESVNSLDESVIKSQDVYSSRVRWAINQAYESQDNGNNNLRDKFLSLALVYLEGDQFENFMRQQNARVNRVPRAAASSDSLAEVSVAKVQKFSRLYGETGFIGDLVDKENQLKIDAAVNKNLQMETWFIAMLEKMGILSKNYKELNDKLRAKFPHLSKDQLTDHLIKQSARLTAGVGFVGALPGVFPGAGTATQIAVNVGTMVPDMIFLFKKQATLIFRIAEIYGKDLKEEERVTEALILFGVASGVSAATRALQQYLENGITIYVREKINNAFLAGAVHKVGALNPILGDILETLFAKKFISEAAVERGVVGLIPLVGAGVSGSMNYMFTRKVGQVARVFYREDPSNRLEALNNMRLPKVELAMFRGLVMMMNADKVQSPVEVLAIEKVVARFPHNHKIVQRLIAGDQELLDKLDYDISNESINVKEQILQSVISLSYVDSEKGPEEVDLQSKMIEKFGIPQKVANDVEIFVKTDNNVAGDGLLGMVKAAYHKYKKLIGVQESAKF